MKIKLLLLIAAISPSMVSFGQGAYLYNKGQMTVKGTGSNQTVLYIQGDFIAGKEADDTNYCNIVLDNSRTVLTGNFKHNAAAPNAKVFQPKPGAVFEFRGSALQAITTDGTTYATIPSKGTAYIDFPNLVINNSSSVTLNPALAAQVTDLSLTKGTFVLQGERITSTNKQKYYASKVTAGSPNPDERSALAHLKVTGNVTYGNQDSNVAADRGFVEIQVPFDPAGSYTKENGRFGSIVGMGIPFTGLKADYFMWNFLLQPSNANYFGPDNQPVVNPRTQLVPGKGYIVGIDLRGNTYADYSPDDFGGTLDPVAAYGLDKFNARFNDGYIFNRTKFAARQNSNNQFGSYSATNDAYTQEKLNTTDVKFRLEKGYNYLANPYTSPLDISELLIASTTPSSWGVIANSTAGARDIRNNVRLLSGTSRGSGKYDLWTPGAMLTGKLLQVETNYYIAKTVGGTYYDDNESNGSSQVLIPPLQMFLIYSEKDMDITIPRSAQAMGINQFIRSTGATRYDDFIFEVIDKKTNSADRVSVVLRPKTEIMSDPTYTDVIKTNISIDNSSVTKSSTELGQAISSQLFTKDVNNNNLMVHFLPYIKNVDAKVSTPLYLKPSVIDQDIVIKGYRLSSLSEFETIILEDKLLGKRVVMTPETEYETTSKSTDKEDRFVLHFTRGLDGIEDDIEQARKTITSYYANGTLTVSGFDDVDFGSTLSVYDIQGRLVRKAKVDDFTVNIVDTFSPGAFIVKVAGNNSYVAKFLVK